MKMSRTSRAWIMVLLAGLVVLAGCARSPEAKKVRHLGRADQYFAREDFREAVIEYQNVLRIEAGNRHAIQRLGLAHYQLGSLAQAFPYLLKSRELDADNIRVRIKLGTIYLLGRRLEEARKEAAFILDKDAKNVEGLSLLAAAARTPGEVDTAILRLEGVRAASGDQAKLHLVLGGLYVRKQDLAAAEHAYKEAVTREPKSVEAHLALGNLYMAKRDVAQAEREFKAAADLAPVNSPASLRLADFYFRASRADEGKRVLSEITQKAPDYLPAWQRLAEIEFTQGKYEDTAKALQVILERNPSDLDGLLLQGRMKLAKGEPADAIQDFQRVLKLEPRLAVAHYQLALAHLRAGNTQQARAELNEAAGMDPNSMEAALLGAELDIRMGAIAPAIEALERITANRPREVNAHILLGLAYLSKREPVKATEVYRKIVALAPKDPRGPHLVGLGLLAQGKRAEAQREFEASLALAPAYVDPLAQLVSVAFDEKKADLALARVQRQITLVPNSGELQFLLGEIHRVRGDPMRAETAYLKALELQPRLVGPYLQLGEVYAQKGDDDQALAKLEGALRLNPQNLPALMLSGVIYYRRGDVSKAEEVYEKALAVNPRFAPAANNLAYLLSARGRDKEKALQWAQKAKEVAPDDPHISDTLGWILYNRGVYQRAFTLLKESAAKLPESPEVQYHFGMASLKAGDKETAKKSLATAAASPANFVGKEEAKKALAQLK
jgi:tetratricopeptide (TPR) repeat protein